MADNPPLAVEDLEAGLTKMAEVLSRRSLKYAVIGGMAAGFRSQPRFTKDLDFLLQVPQLALPAALEELKAHGFSFDLTVAIRQWTQDHMTVLDYRGIRVDWLKPLIPAYQHVLELATEEKWLGRPIRVASVEGLILLKLVAFRLQDQLDIENLAAARGESLDLAWIQSEWQSIAPLDDPRMLWLANLQVPPA